MSDYFDDLDTAHGDVGRESLPWWQRAILKMSPRAFLKLEAWRQGVDEGAMDYADKLFGGKRIHLQPLSGVGGRGFIVTIDNKLTLWFFQDGNHFTYDGFELGEYNDGEVTIVDDLSKE